MNTFKLIYIHRYCIVWQQFPVLAHIMFCECGFQSLPEIYTYLIFGKPT